MSDGLNKLKRLCDLLDAQRDDGLSDERMQQINALLRDNPSLQRFYVRYTSMWAQLRFHLADYGVVRDASKSDSAAAMMTEAILRKKAEEDVETDRMELILEEVARSAAARHEREASQALEKQQEASREAERRESMRRLAGLGKPGDQSQTRHYVIPRPLFYGSIAAIVAIAAMIFWPDSGNRSVTPEPGGIESQESIVVAELLEQVGAKWEVASGVLEVGSEIHNRPLKLVEGMARLRFVNGAEIILESPVSFEPTGPDRVTISGGKLVGLCPTEESQGFAVIAPNARIVDLGTEFAVQVEDSGKTQMHVYAGKIEMSGISNGRVATDPIEISAGQAREVDPTGTRHSAIEVDPIGFVRNREFDANVKAARSKYQRWIASSYRMMRDESLLAFFTFDDDEPLPELALHTAGNSDVTLEHLSKRPGRFGEGQSVSFFETDSRAAFHVNEEYEQLTMAGWFRVDRLDHDLVALMMSDGFGEVGLVHWQLLRTGEMRFTQRQADGEINLQSKDNVIRGNLHKWVHLACVVDVLKSQVTFYVNGEMMTLAGTGEPTPLRNVHIGDASLGYWNDPDPNYGVPMRTLAGEIDEFAIFARALSEREIVKMYETGNPY